MLHEQRDSYISQRLKYIKEHNSHNSFRIGDRGSRKKSAQFIFDASDTTKDVRVSLNDKTFTFGQMHDSSKIESPTNSTVSSPLVAATSYRGRGGYKRTSGHKKLSRCCK